MNEEWEEGYQAAANGLSREENPYLDEGPFSDRYCDWDTGWECAAADAKT